MKKIIKSVLEKTGLLSIIYWQRERKDMNSKREAFKKQYPEATSNYFVHPTAVLEKTELIEIGEGAEINDYVIIRTQKRFVHRGY